MDSEFKIQRRLVKIINLNKKIDFKEQVKNKKNIKKSSSYSP